MKLFQKKEQETRSVDDILTPKGNEEDMISENESNDEQEPSTCEKEANICLTDTPISAFDCFGISENKTEKWLSNCVKVWYYAISFLWFFFGAVTFAPIIFVSNKVNVLFKDKKKSLLCGAIIHIVLICLIIIFFVTRHTPTNIPTT